jgi:branched-chain amino acid transport system permease protein
VADAQPASAPGEARARLPARFGRAGLLVLVGLALVAAGPLVLDTYSVNILIRSFLYGCIAVTVDVLWGYAGILSFGQSAFFAIGAYALGLASSQFGLSPLVASASLLGGLAIAGAVAAVIGWLAFGYGVPPLYVSVVTLVLSVIFVQVIYAGGDVTGSSSGLSNFDTFDLSTEGWFRLAGVALVAVTALGWVLVRSDLGRMLVAVRENEQRCAYFGVPIALVKTGLLVTSALVAALAGYAYAGYNDVVAPDLGSFQFGTELVIWVALGGRGTLIGPAVAAVVIDFVSAYLSGSLPYVWQLLVGVVFVAVIVLMPQGLGPALAALLGRLRRGGRVAPPVARLAPAGNRAAVAGSVSVPIIPGLADAAIAVAGVARHFGSLRVLEDIAFTARRGELVSLVGPNGAGKTTLIRCIADGHERSAGRVAIQGTAIGRMSPERCVRLGLGRKFQAPNVFDALTVGESLRVARTRHERLSPWARAGAVRLPAGAMRVVRATGLDAQLATEVHHLSHGAKQALELAMVLAMEPTILLLDEPTAGLTGAERRRIGDVLVELVRDHGLCILLVEHDLEFVREISSRVIVLHQGRIVLDGSVEEVAGSELVRTIYTGEPQALGAPA